MKDTATTELVSNLSAIIDHLNNTFRELYANDVSVQLSVGKGSAIEPVSIKIISVLQIHDYAK